MKKSMDSLSKTDVKNTTEIASDSQKTEIEPMAQDLGESLPPKDSYDSLFPEPTIAIEPPPQWIWWVLLIIGSIGLGFVGFKLVNGGLNNWLTPSPAPSVSVSTSPVATSSPSKLASPSASATPTPSATPSSSATPSPSATPSSNPTASPTPDPKSSLKIRILNGTTIAGKAATAKTTLTKAGYTVRLIGNASAQNYTSSIIYYQTGKLADAQAIQTALPAYSFTLEESSLVSPDNILVIIGLK